MLLWFSKRLTCCVFLEEDDESEDFEPRPTKKPKTKGKSKATRHRIPKKPQAPPAEVSTEGDTYNPQYPEGTLFGLLSFFLLLRLTVRDWGGPSHLGRQVTSKDEYG